MQRAEQGPPSHCWFLDDVDVRDSDIEGRGLFARSFVPRGTVVARLGGRLVTRDELNELFAAQEANPQRPYIDCISIEEGVDLLMEPGQPIHFGNHSCDPNVWHTDAFTLEARRDIDTGEEMTLDYATQTDNAAFSMTCRCGTPRCRGTITGADWRLSALQERYGDHWVPVLLDRIRRERARP